MKIPFLKPAIREEDIQASADAIRTGWLVHGEQTENFEKEFAAYLGAKEAVFTNSCTCSLELMLPLMGVGEGDEVITTPLTYVSSVAPILHSRAKVVFVDVDSDTGNINLDQVAAGITDRTKAILPVHLNGQMVDMNQLAQIADEHQLQILEDAAHAIEAERDGVRPAAKSSAACFSFHTAKNLAAGYGGAIALNDSDVAEKLRILRRDGTHVTKDGRRMVALGHKYLGTEAQAAMLRTQLRRLDDQWKRRRQLFERYASAFDEHDIDYNKAISGTKHAYHMMVMRVDPKRRAEIRKQLANAGIETSVHYDPVHLEPYFREAFGYKGGEFPVAEKIGFASVSLPLYFDLSDEEQEYVISEIIKTV